MQTNKFKAHCSQLNNESIDNRRRFLKVGFGICALASIPLAIPLSHAKMLQPMERKLSFLNLHTGERVKSVYWAEGQYIPEALEAIRNILRDHRTGDLHTMDTKLFNLLHLIQSKMDSDKEFHVISGFRSAKTNAMLASRSNGVAKTSLHIQGKAIDIRLPGHQLSDLRAAALSMHAGGVGYYPRSNFIHIDTGYLRTWSG